MHNNARNREIVGRRKNKTLQEATRIGLDRITLLRYVQTGIIPALRVNSRLYLYDPEMTDAALEAYAKTQNHTKNGKEVSV